MSPQHWEGGPERKNRWGSGGRKGVPTRPEPSQGMQTHRRPKRVRNPMHFTTALFLWLYEVSHAAHHQRSHSWRSSLSIVETSSINFEMFSRPKLFLPCLWGENSESQGKMYLSTKVGLELLQKPIFVWPPSLWTWDIFLLQQKYRLGAMTFILEHHLYHLLLCFPQGTDLDQKWRRPAKQTSGSKWLNCLPETLTKSPIQETYT